MPYEHKPNELSIFKNTKKDKDTQPDYTGDGKISGEELGIGSGEVIVRVVAWINKMKDGTEYYKLKVQKKEDKDIPF